MLSVKQIETFLIKEAIPYFVEGSREIAVDSFSQLDRISEHRIIWVKNWTDEIQEKIDNLRNLIVICPQGMKSFSRANCYIISDEPKMCFFEILAEFFTDKQKTGKISEHALIETENVGAGCRIGDYACIGSEAELGSNVEIGSHVIIQGRVRIGDNSIIHAGAVIGKSGYGYYAALDGHNKRVPHLGGIVIGNYVEIGANTCIDCGTMEDTVIGDYTKIDNLCHIGHNVQIGRDVLIVAGSILCGSSRIEDRSYIAPGAVIKNQIRIGKNAFVGMQTAVMKDVETEGSVFGVPGRAFKREYKI